MPSGRSSDFLPPTFFSRCCFLEGSADDDALLLVSAFESDFGDGFSLLDWDEEVVVDVAFSLCVCDVGLSVDFWGGSAANVGAVWLDLLRIVCDCAQFLLAVHMMGVAPSQEHLGKDLDVNGRVGLQFLSLLVALVDKVDGESVGTKVRGAIVI